MDERIPALEKLRKACSRLREALEVPVTSVVQDGVIQRFEFSFELAWKTLKIFLRQEGIVALTPREALKGGFRAGWITDESAFLSMLNDRNLTSHLYDEAEASSIFERIKDVHAKTLE